MNRHNFALPKTITWMAVFGLLLILFLQGVYSAWTLGQTVDETFYNGTGYALVRYNNYKFIAEHPPLIIQLGALPLLFLQPKFPIENYVRLPGTDLVDISKTGAQFLYQMGNDPQWILFLERVPMILLTVILGFGIFQFGREVYGKWGALLALLLYTFTPDVIGNGSLYMTDMGVTVFYFFAIYAVKKFFDGPTAQRVTIAGIACGLAFVSKISSLILIPVVLCLFFIYYFSELSRSQIPEPSSRFQTISFWLALFVLLNALGSKLAMFLFGPFLLLVLYLIGREMSCFNHPRWMSFIFRGLILSGAVLCIVFSWYVKEKFNIKLALLGLVGIIVFMFFALYLSKWPSSDHKIRLMKYFLMVWVFADLVVILDHTDILFKLHRFVGFNNYMKPLKIVISHLQGGHSSCIPGSFITCDWRYFPLVIAVKTPLLVLFLLGIGTFLILFSRRPVLLKAIFLVPVIFFLGTAMANKINIGLRHVLPIFPFLFLLGGFAGAKLIEIRPGLLKKFFIIGLSFFLILFAVRTLRMVPDYLVYFNEAIGSIEQGSKFMISNWGQDNKALAEFVLEKKIPSIKISGEMVNPDVYDYYKIRWEIVSENDWATPKPGFYALGIATYVSQQNNPHSWFKGRRPLFRVGKTYYIFQAP